MFYDKSVPRLIPAYKEKKSHSELHCFLDILLQINQFLRNVVLFSSASDISFP